jgi:hypothetical protein
MNVEVPLQTLSVGSRFGLLLETTGRVIRGKLLHLSSCSALVEWESIPRTVEVHDSEGVERVFQANVKKKEHVSLQTPVIPQVSNEEYNERILA